MRFHLIDRIDAYQPGESVRARKLTSVTEELWIGSAADPVMPRPLILESLCQAGSWLIIASTNCRKRAALLQIGSVEFLGDVRPGEVIELTGEIASLTEEMAVLSGTARVGARLVLSATDIMCALIDVDELEESGDTARMQGQLLRVAAS